MARAPGEMQAEVLRLAGTGATVLVANAALDLGVRPRAVSRAASALVARGWLRRSHIGIYEITEAGSEALAAGVVITSGPIRPTGRVRIVSDTLRDRAWRAMRVRRRFTLGELVADAEGGEARPRENIRRYVAVLRAAGYLRELPNRQPGTAMTSNGFKRFMLVRDTGPRAPVYRPSSRTLHDPNTREDRPCATS